MMNDGAYSNPPLLGYKVISTNREVSVWWIQQKLNRIYPNNKVAEDNKLGNETLSLIRKFQIEHGLSPDGIVGPKTYQALCTADPWKDKKVNNDMLIQKNGMLPKDEKPTLDYILCVSIIQSVLDKDTFVQFEKFMQTKNWSGLVTYINTKITARMKAKDPEILACQKNINEAYIRKQSSSNGKWQNDARFNNKIIAINQSRIDLKLNSYKWTPDVLFKKLEPLCATMKAGMKTISYFEPIQIATEWIWHFFPYEKNRSQQWINESAHIQSKLIDSLVKGLVCQFLAVGVGIVISTYVSSGWAIVLTIIAGIIIGVLVEVISNFIGNILTGDSSLTGLETIAYCITKQSQPFVTWANTK